MTAQIPERLHHAGREVAMTTTPLEDFFGYGGKPVPFGRPSTALWRGYVGEWEITGDRLYLIGLDGVLRSGEQVTLGDVFPGYERRVFAHWYTGTIRVPEGGQIKYVHMGFGSIYERDVLLDFERGVLKQKRVRHNGQAASDAPQGYDIGGMTTLPIRQTEEEASP